jgi:hypothetical protein
VIISRIVSAILRKLNPGNLTGGLFVLWLLCCSSALAGEQAGVPLPPAEQSRVFALPESRAMRPPVMEEIPGSDRTIRTFAQFDGEELRMLSSDEVQALDAGKPGWRDAAVSAPDALWDSIEVQFLRDPDGVVIAAVLDGTSQETCSVLFDSGLVDRMEDTFGPEFFVAVPTRFRLMIFPKLASRIAEFAPVVLSDHRVSPYPVSPEVFEISRAGVRVAGVLDDR